MHLCLKIEIRKTTTIVIARSESDEAIQTVAVERFWIASLALAMTAYETYWPYPACPTGIAACGNASAAPRPANRSACITASVSTAIAQA